MIGPCDDIHPHYTLIQDFMSMGIGSGSGNSLDTILKVDIGRLGVGGFALSIGIWHGHLAWVITHNHKSISPNIRNSF